MRGRSRERALRRWWFEVLRPQEKELVGWGWGDEGLEGDYESD